MSLGHDKVCTIKSAINKHGFKIKVVKSKTEKRFERLVFDY